LLCIWLPECLVIIYHPITFTIRMYVLGSGVGCCVLQISRRHRRRPVFWYSLWYCVSRPGFSMFSACGVHTGMTVHSWLKSFLFAKLVHYCTEKYLCAHLSQVHVDGSTHDATYVPTPGSLAYAPSAGGLGGVPILRTRV
jgi:hypothetical protein